MKHTNHSCDICKNAAKHLGQDVQMVFLTEQTEGRYCTPHLSTEKLDLCDECLNRLIERNPLNGQGAQGHNTYSFVKDITP